MVGVSKRRWAALMVSTALMSASFAISAAPSAAATAVVKASTAWQRTGDGVVVSPARGMARNVRVIVMTPTIFRVIAAADAKISPADSLAVNAVPDAATQYTVFEKNGILTVKTASASVDIALADGKVIFRDAAGKAVLSGYDGGQFAPVKVDGQDFYAVRQEFNRGTDEGFYGLGQHQNGQMNYNGEDVILAQHNMDVAVPFVVSTRNYGVLWDNASVTRFGYPKEYAALSAQLKLRDASGKEGGLTARYYTGAKLAVERVENDPDYQFIPDTRNMPAAVSNPDHVAVHSGEPVPYSENLKVVWEGSLESAKSGMHKFRFYVGGYFKVWVDDKLVLNSWRQGWQAWYQNIDLPMKAGVARKFRAEWFPDGASYLRFLHLDPMADAERHELSLASEVARTIDYYYIAGNSMDDVIAGYRHLTGKAQMLPKWAYGFWQSRQRYTTQDDLVNVVKTYREQKLPLDAIVQDWRYWKDPQWGSHDFDSSRFPDPKKMVDDVHAMNAKLMLVIWPKFDVGTANFKEFDNAGLMYRRAIDQNYIDWVKPGYVSSYYDAYSKKARDIYWTQIEAKLDPLKPDAWWMDNDEPDIHSNMDIEERIRMMGPTAVGPAAQYFNTYPLVHVCGFYDHWKKAHPDERTLLFTRSGFAGLQNCSAMVWSGDTASTWDVFRHQISAGVNMSMSGLPNWSFDIGGFTPEARMGGYLDDAQKVYTPPKSAEDLNEWTELYTRWFQFGAFAPVFRSHGEIRHREIYEIAGKGSEVYNTLAWYDALRYRLMPYIYSVAAASYHDDATIMRGLAMDFSADVKARNIGDEYLFGPNLLVAPVTEYKARTRRVYLPAGTRWYDFYTGAAYDGGAFVEATAPLSRIPVFVREGAIVPSGPVMQYTDQKTEAPITLTVFTGRDGRFTLYDDDGKTDGYMRGEYSRIQIRYDEARGTLSIGARQGTYPGMIVARQIRIRWVRGAPQDLTDFDTLSGRVVQYTGSAISVQRPAGG